MILIGHLMTIGLRISARDMHIGRIAIEQHALGVVQTDYVERRTILDLHPQKTLCYFRQHLRASQPTAHHARHSVAAGLFAICPSSQRCSLRQSSADLPCPHKKPPSTFSKMNRWIELTGHG